MNMEEEEFSPYAAFSSGCDIHGEDFLRECTMCGIEFCSACFPQSPLCSDCAAQGDIENEDLAETTEEEKELILLDGIQDDKHRAPPKKGLPIPPVKKAAPAPKAKGKAKPAPQAKAPAKARLKAKPKAKKLAKPASKAKTKKSAKLSPKAKTKPKPKKPAKPASKKRKA